MINMLKSLIKRVILKPTYKLVYHICPDTAVAIKETILNKRRKGFCKRSKPYFFIDTTQVSFLDEGTGISRVVNNINKNLFMLNEKRMIDVIDIDGKLSVNSAYMRKHSLKDVDFEEVFFVARDKLLLLDSSWGHFGSFKIYIQNAEMAMAKTYAVVYDILPLTIPEYFRCESDIEGFRRWHNMIFEYSDEILCISKSTADEVEKYYLTSGLSRKKPLQLHFFHMGATLPSVSVNVRGLIRDFISNKKKKTFLMVGTVEPRKGHLVAIEAFEKLYKDSNECLQLLILGHKGWKDELTKEIIKKTTEMTNVLWIDDATDEELNWAYQNVAALIAASKDEGFGLPLVEAAHFGLPIICSDIPIFREVTQGYADYFNVMDADDLARCITEWLQTEKHPDSRDIRIYTWQESAQEILDIVDGKVEPYKMLS